jgi:hypothetical protein
MSTRKHFAKILGMAIVASLAIAAFAAASASASHWKVEGAKLAEGTANGKGVSAALKAGTTATLKGKLLGQEFVLTATTLSSSEGRIYQEGTESKDEGFLEFSGLTVDKPAGCGIESPIKTKALKSLLVDHSTSTHAYDKFFPAEGEVFATIKVTGCAVAGSYNVKGTTFGEGNVWGEEFVEQSLNFSPAINTTLGGALTLGTSAAELTLEGVNTLNGAEAGKKFGAETN